MKILIPYLHDGNTYMQLLAKGVGETGHEAVRATLKEGLKQWPDVLWIHWPEHLSLGTPPTQTALVGFNELLGDFCRRGGTVVWTVHNLWPHAYPNHPGLRSLYAITAGNALVQVHHGWTSVREAQRLYPPAKGCITKVVHHGGYWNLMGGHTKESAREKLGLPAEGKILLAFGSLRSQAEYEMVMAAAKVGWEVVLAGRLPVAKLWERPGRWLDRKMVGKRWHHMDGHIPDSDVDAILKAADAVLIARNHTLNSGNVYLGMTFGRAIVGPMDGNTGEILRGTGNFVFDVEDRASLKGVLGKMLGMDPGGLGAVGAANGEWLRANAQWKPIAQAVVDAIGELRGGCGVRT